MATSIVKAEYKFMSKAAKKIAWTQSLLYNFKVNMMESSPLHYNNLSATKLIKNLYCIY